MTSPKQMEKRELLISGKAKDLQERNVIISHNLVQQERMFLKT